MLSKKTGLTQAINWNNLDDPVDEEIWSKLTENFWLPEKVAVSNDMSSWRLMSDVEKEATLHVFTGLTMLDTIQGVVGATSLMKDALTPHEEAVLTNISFMEAVHARSYSYIFSTLCSTEEIDEAFRWSENNEYLQHKARTVEEFYRGGDALRKKAASTLLESFLFYSGFYFPFKMASRKKLVNSTVVVSLIVRDEAIHGFYIGYKFQKMIKAMNLTEEEKQQLEDDVYELLQGLYENEVRYAQEIYDELGWTEDVKGFLRWNANRALANLGYPALFDESECDFDPAVRSAMSGGSDNHDFFSTTSSSYVIGKREEMSEEDWDDDDLWDEDEN